MNFQVTDLSVDGINDTGRVQKTVPITNRIINIFLTIRPAIASSQDQQTGGEKGPEAQAKGLGITYPDRRVHALKKAQGRAI